MVRYEHDALSYCFSNMEVKMTLYASIEKMKAALKHYAANSIFTKTIASEALAAAPAQALSEEEIIKLFYTPERERKNVIDTIRALKENGVLYVREG